MIYCPPKYNREFKNFNKELLEITGELSEKDARLKLIEFLRHNLGFATELISGIKLAAYQELTLRGFFNRNFSMCVFGRGLGKSFLAAVYCFLQTIFEPNTKILIAGPTFRTARNIFEELEKMVNADGAKLLQQAFSTPPVRRNDLFFWNVNGGSIKAIPLNGEKIRGFRANVLLLDEFLLLSKDMVDNVLKPFLVAPNDTSLRMKIRAEERELIRQGKMKEEDRAVFETNSKMICLSSASYTFENLYDVYSDWTSKILDDSFKDERTYFVCQLGWEAVPAEMLDETIIKEAQGGGSSEQSFLREYCAQFTDGSDSFFSAKKMHACTVKDGYEPTVEIRGEKDAEYVLAIDPSFSNSPTSDDFAMSLMKLEPETKTSVLVNSYAVSGGNLKDHIKYLYYLLTNFNIVLIIIDNAGWTFVDSANESEYFRQSDILLKFFDFDSDKEGVDYIEMLKQSRVQYNKTSNKIVFKQNFTSDFIRKGNELLAANIEHKRTFFASHLTPHATAYEAATNIQINKDLLPEETIFDFIAYQDGLIDLTKKECSLIEISTTIKGTQSFDLPQNLKRNTSATRARKDNYTSLLLGNWGVRCYYDLMNLPTERVTTTFTPIIIR